MFDWKNNLKLFFERRSLDIDHDEISDEQLCWVSGRDPRLWTDKDLYNDLIDSICEQLDVQAHHSILEVGCAAGFLAKGLAPLVSNYVGVDLAPNAIKVAKSLGLKNAQFKHGDGKALQFPDGSFDRVLSYDVFTNIPSFDFAKDIVLEMFRVTKPDGLLMIGSLADEEKKEAYVDVVHRISADLETKLGPVKNLERIPSIFKSFHIWYLKKIKKIEPQIICFYFKKSDFISLGNILKVSSQIFDIHKKNPYSGYRFNVVMQKAK